MAAAAEQSRIVVNHTRGERAFPLGEYSRIADKRGSVGHELRRLRFMPGLNDLDRAIVGQRRAAVDAAEFGKVMKHPAMKRLIDQGHVATYPSLAAIPKRDRMLIAANTIDIDVLEGWLKVEGDEHVRVELRKQVDKMAKQGLTDDDRQVTDAPVRMGQTPSF